MGIHVDLCASRDLAEHEPRGAVCCHEQARDASDVVGLTVGAADGPVAGAVGLAPRLQAPVFGRLAVPGLRRPRLVGLGCVARAGAGRRGAAGRSQFRHLHRGDRVGVVSCCR